jgi:hypothetical protein
MAYWDPIGVAGVPEAADEYDAYLPAIWRELRDGSKESLSSYLHDVTLHMGLPVSRDREREAAERLGRWWTERGGTSPPAPSPELDC